MAKFQKGQSGNPNGRPKGSLNQTTRIFRERLESKADELIQAVIAKAIEGEPTAMRLCIERLIPATRERALNVQLPAIESITDCTTASKEIIGMTANGELLPGEAKIMVSLLQNHVSLLEGSDLEQQIESMKKALKEIANTKN